ncbi:MAG TPA: Uma2 family endonuclease [Haliangiales bacterium]|nr:Uma2 family endonuclease [Haliangiales bacterium]
MTVAKPIHRLTEAEYLDFERSIESKNEFFDGEVYAMSGGTPLHSLIATNLAREFGIKLKGRSCVPFNSDLRLKVEATGLLTYPDLSVVCGPLQCAAGTDDTLVNPTVIVEVLSDSTEAYDRGKKFENYRQVPSLREYLLVSQKEPRIEQFIREPSGQWLLREAAGLESTLVLPSLEINVSLAEVFAGAEFVPAPIRAQTPPRR